MNAFPNRPVSDLPDYSRSHLHKGRDYQEGFERWPGRAVMWELEQQAIPELLEGAAPKTALDFATGTGRIARLLKQTFPDCRVVGADISAKMLSVAKDEGGDIEYVQLDGRKATEQLKPKSFDVATAFRFFPNADLALRAEAADQLAKLLKPGGLLLVNNHRNFWSLAYMLPRLVLRRKPVGMINSELIDLFTSRGFVLDSKISLGLAPSTEKKTMLPWSLVRSLERLNLKVASRSHSAGRNTLFLFKKVS